MMVPLMARPTMRTPGSHPAPGRPLGHGRGNGRIWGIEAIPGLQIEPTYGVGNEAIVSREQTHLRCWTSDRTQFCGGTDPFRAAGARTKPLFPRIEPILEVGREIEANL